MFKRPFLLAASSLITTLSIPLFSAATPLSKTPVEQVSVSPYPQSFVLYSERERPGVELLLTQYIDASQGDTRSEAETLFKQGEAYYQTSDYSAALSTWEEALALSRAVGNRAEEAKMLGRVGIAHRQLGDREQALVFLEESLALSRELKNEPIEAFALDSIGTMHYLVGDYSAALEYYEQSLAISQRVGDRATELLAISHTGMIAQVKGDLSQAEAYYEQGIAISRELGDRFNEAKILQGLSSIAVVRGQLVEASLHLEQALAISREIGWRGGEAENLLRLSGVYALTDDYPKALSYAEEALAITREIGDRFGESAVLSDIGNYHIRSGEPLAAIDYYQQSLALIQGRDRKEKEVMILNNIGVAYEQLSNYPKAIEYQQQSLATSQSTGNRLGMGAPLGNLAAIYFELGDEQKSLAYLEQELAIAQEVGDKIGESIVLGKLGVFYRSQAEYALALDYLEQSLAAQKNIGSQSQEAIALTNIGGVYYYKGDYERALSYCKQALAISQSIGDRDSESFALSSIGSIYGAQNKTEEALKFYQDSLTIMQESGNRSEIAHALSRIGGLFSQQAQPDLAIVFLKKSVNQYETIRKDNQQLSSELQTLYTDSIASNYKTLADLLLQQNRVLEAQRVIDLLKVQEAQDYLNTVRGNTRTASGVDFWQPEQAILEKYNALQSSAIEIGTQLAALQQKDIAQGLSAEEAKQRNELYQVQKEIQQQFTDFASSTDIEPFLQQLAQTDGNLNISELAGVRDKLSELNAALLYPLVLEDRIELIITTPNSPPLRRTVENVSKAELNAAILAFREALQSPYSDAKTPAYQLYRWLIEPIEADLAAANLETILYAPDGPLRYVPLAALYNSADPDDGQWLVERLQINNITATSLQELDTQPVTAPRVLAGAFADSDITHNVTVGEQTISLAGLPFAGVEVATLAETLEKTRTYLDASFSLGALEPQFNNFNILHFATHAALVPKDAGESFILFGNGDKPTLKDIASWSMQDVDLVVLSACETGLGGFDNNGEQILGLGYQFQSVGARAVLASLWSVDDGGTQALMNAFYVGLKNGYSKTEALQRSQQALIKNDLTLVGAARGATIEVIDTNTGQPIESASSSDHPYYWAPFILIGNGL